jgi:hypothetical protein
MLLFILQIIARIGTFASFGFLGYYVFKDFKNIGLDDLTEEGETLLRMARWALISLTLLASDYIIFYLR